VVQWRSGSLGKRKLASSQSTTSHYPALPYTDISIDLIALLLSAAACVQKAEKAVRPSCTGKGVV